MWIIIAYAGYIILLYRVDRSEHTLLRATADVIDRFPSDTTFQAAEVFVCTWHRTSVFAPDEANVNIAILF